MRRGGHEKGTKFGKINERLVGKTRREVVEGESSKTERGIETRVQNIPSVNKRDSRGLAIRAFSRRPSLLNYRGHLGGGKMDKKEFIRQLFLSENTIREFKKKWPNPPDPKDSPDDTLKAWHSDWKNITNLFPEVDPSFLRWSQDDEFIRSFSAKKELWLDPIISKRARSVLFDACNKIATEEERELLLTEKKQHDDLTPEAISALRQTFGEKYFKTAAMAIPVYPDTRLEDIEQLWPQIVKFKKLLYGKSSAPKHNKYETSLMIFRYGQCKELSESAKVSKFTEKLLPSKYMGMPWENLAKQLNITPQACNERYNELKQFLRYHEKEDKRAEISVEEKEATISTLDCETCEKKEKCPLIKTGKGECPYVTEVLGKGELSYEAYIPVEDYENKKARGSGWQAENEFIKPLNFDD